MSESSPVIQIFESSPLKALVSIPLSPLPAGQKRPVLCFLHGYAEAAPIDIRAGVTRHGPLRPGNTSLATDPFLVVAPQLPRPGGDVWGRYADPVRRIISDVQQIYGGDAQRTYLTGFSFGANGVADLALAQSGFWAAFWLVDPTRVPSASPPGPIWLSVGEASRSARARFIRALGLEPAGGDLNMEKLWRDDGEDHVGSARRAYDDEQIYRWLLSKRLRHNPAEIVP